MEQLDTDKNLVDKKENKNSHYVLIGVWCIIIVIACFLFFKSLQSKSPASSGGK